MSRMESYTVKMAPEMWSALRSRTARTKVPTSEYIRQALAEWLERNPEPNPASGPEWTDEERAELLPPPRKP